MTGLLLFPPSRPNWRRVHAQFAAAACAVLVGTWATWAASAAAATAAAARGAAPAKIVLLSIDGLPAGAELQPDRMPALAGLAAVGARCAEACSPAAVPFPAWVELLTGCGPARTLVRDEFTRGLGEKPPTLAARLRALGYRCAGLPGDPLAHSGSGLARGFERYEADAPALSDSARVDSALAWLALPGRRFAWIGLTFGAPAEAWRRTDGIGPRDPAGFASRARQLDAALARLVAGLDRAGRTRATLLAVTGTGAVPGRTADVPIVFCGPAARAGRAGRRIVAPASLADVAPTLVAVAGGSVAGFDGIDLLALPRPAARAGGRSCAPARFSAETDPLAAPESCATELFVRTDRGASRPDSSELANWDRLVARCPGSARVALERDVARSRARTGAGRGARAQGRGRRAGGRPARHARLRRTPAARRSRRPRARRAQAHPGARTPSPRSPRGGSRWPTPPSRISSPPRAPPAAPPHWRHPPRRRSPCPARLHALQSLRDSTSRDAARSPGCTCGTAARWVTSGSSRPPTSSSTRRAAWPPPAPSPTTGWRRTWSVRAARSTPCPRWSGRSSCEPDYLPARLALADALLELGRRHEAREQLERVRGSLGSDARSLYNLACLRATEGEIPGALDALERAVAAGYADVAGLDGRSRPGHAARGAAILAAARAPRPLNAAQRVDPVSAVR